MTLELGGNAAVVVDEDVPDMNTAVDRILFGAFYQSGQSCISVQRVLVHSKVYDEFKEKLVKGAAKVNKFNSFSSLNSEIHWRKIPN